MYEHDAEQDTAETKRAGLEIVNRDKEKFTKQNEVEREEDRFFCYEDNGNDCSGHKFDMIVRGFCDVWSKFSPTCTQTLCALWTPDPPKFGEIALQTPRTSRFLDC